METLISYFKLALNSVKNNYVNFSGRATRTEYFSVLVSSLFLFIIAGILLIVPVLGTIIFVLYTGMRTKSWTPLLILTKSEPVLYRAQSS